MNCRLTREQALALADAFREKAERIVNGEAAFIFLECGGDATITVGLQD